MQTALHKILSEKEALVQTIPPPLPIERVRRMIVKENGSWHLVNYFLICLLSFITCSIHAQNVGIGTLNPQGNLHIVSSGTSGYAGNIILQASNMTVGSSTVLMLGKNNITGNQAELRYTYNGDNNSNSRYEFGFSNIQPFVAITEGQFMGIGTLTPTAKLHVLGNVRIEDGTQAAGKVLTSDASGVASWQTPTTVAETDPQVTSTTTNKIPKWNGTTLVDGLITDNGTNIGIGTTNPAAKLDIVSGNTTGYAASIMLHAPNMLPGSQSVIQFGKDTTIRNQAEMRFDYTGDNYPYNKFEFGFSHVPPFVAFTADEKVGIGTIYPYDKLQVAVNGTTGYTGGITLEAPNMLPNSTTSMTIGKFPSSGNRGEIHYRYMGDNSPSNRIEFTFYGVNPFVAFTRNQRVGIGTLEPTSSLHVLGQFRLEDGSQGANKVLMSDTTGNASWQPIANLVETDPQVDCDSINRLPKWNGTSLVDGIITDNGTNVGIGTSSPSAKLHVVGQVRIEDGLQAAGKVLTSNNLGVASWLSLPAFIETDPKVATTVSNCVPKWNGTALADGLIYDNGTNVGIGTSNPVTKLHVAGKIKIVDGTQGAGKVLTSDTAGVAAWQTLPVFIETDPQVGSSTINKIPKWNGSTLVDGVITDNGTNVGIGAPNPTHPLTLGGTDVVFGVQNASLFVAKNSSGGEEPYLYPRWIDDRMLMNYGAGGFQMRDNAFNTRFQITSTGNVGIGTSAPNGLFELTLDQGRKPSTSTWTITSDARVKNIEGQYTKGLNEILQLNPILYHYKNTSTKTFSPEVLATENVGLTAQEVQQVFPEAVGVDPDGTLNLNMHPILIAQINAVKDLNSKVEQQQLIIDHQQELIQNLTAKLDEVLNQLSAKN